MDKLVAKPIEDRKNPLVYRDERHIEVDNIALKDALSWATVSFLAGLVFTIVATKRSHWYRSYMAPAAKSAVPIMAGVGVFGSRYEMVIIDAIRHPESYGLEPTPEAENVPQEIVLPIHHQAANYMYAHPFKMIAMLGLPLTAFIVRQQLSLKHIPFSQRIMCSRVYAQGGVLSIIMAVFGFQSYMEKRGTFTGVDPKKESESI